MAFVALLIHLAILVFTAATLWIVAKALRGMTSLLLNLDTRVTQLETKVDALEKNQ